MAYKKIIDISKHNGTIDFKKVKKDGVVAVIIRAGYGRNNIDAWFKRYAAGAKAAGLPIGIYWFSYAYTKEMAEKEAEYCIAAIKPYKIALPVFFDWEYDSMRYAKTKGVTPSRALVTAMCKAFCTKIQKVGYDPGVYYNQDYRLNYLNAEQLAAYRTWYAKYSSSPGYDCDIWQYSESGRVSGISGDVDMDYLINVKLLDTSGSSGSSSKKSVTTLAKEVIAGKWGDGDERKKRLEAAGYNYSAVQRKVNELVSKKSVTEIAKEVIAGEWGNGADRKKKLKAAGYDYDAVQKKVNELVK